MQTVSVLIPTMNASPWLCKQLKALHSQTVKIDEIVIIDSQSEDDTCAIASADPLCRLICVQRADFDHGGTRALAASTCSSTYLWFLTQDAIPADASCLEELIRAVSDEKVACAYGRQIAAEDASRLEQLNRQHNYPSQSFVRSAKDIPSCQIRAFFLSNTCCLYKREPYLRCGGFEQSLPTNEDMLMAANFLHHGYATAYCAQARVQHTHHLSLKQWYQRSFDIGAFTTMFQKQLEGVKAQGAGKQYALFIIKQLLKEGHVLSFFHFGLICVARLLGDRAGHRFQKLPNRAILRRTQNKGFWQRYLND
ncbi:MAG: glycosyltransferase family 2 protein [Clostridia bacterium]